MNLRCDICLEAHATLRCPKIGGVRCKATGCREDHDKHFCEHCGNQNANHVAAACPDPSPSGKPGCDVPGCKLNHGRQSHSCRVCRMNEADHVEANCLAVVCDPCAERQVQHIHGKCDTKLVARRLFHQVRDEAFESVAIQGSDSYQTDKEHARNIVKEGEFRRGTAGIVGPAVYFSECPEHTTEKAWRRGWIVEAFVHVGESPLLVSSVGNPTLDATSVPQQVAIVERYEINKPNIFAVYAGSYITIVDAYPVPR